MAADFVSVNDAAKFGRVLRDYVLQVRRTLELSDQLRDQFDHMVDGSNYTMLESQFGLAAGQGQVVYNLVAGTRAALFGSAQSSDATTLVDRIG